MKPLKIKSVKKIHYRGNVHNLAVEGDETYFADGMLVHNCRSTLVAILVGESESPDSYFQNYREEFPAFGEGVTATQPAKGFGGN